MGRRASVGVRRILALVSILALVVACTGETSDSTTAPDGTEAPGGTDGDGGGDVNNPDVFVHAADDEATTVDPAQVEAGEGGETIITQVYERLVEIGPDGPDLIPGLADRGAESGQRAHLRGRAHLHLPHPRRCGVPRRHRI